MNKALKIVLSVVLLAFINAKAVAHNKKGNNPEKPSNESDTTIKSNIVIFKIISPSSETQQNSGNNGSLKKAGKLARTSTSPHSAIDELIFTKRGI